MQNFENKVYYSKIDWWFFIAIIFIVGVLTNIFVHSSYLPDINANIISEIIGLLAAIPAFGFVIYLAKETKYTLEAKGLRIYSPIFYNYVVPYSEICSVKKSHDLTSAPAFSLSRIKIKFGKESKFLGFKFQKFALISPPNRDEFIAEINSRIEAAK